MHRRSLLSTMLIGLLVSSASAQTSELSASLTDVVNAPEPTVKTTQLKISPGFMARSMEDQYANSKYAGGLVNIAGERKFGQYFAARMNADFQVTTGAFTNQYSEEGRAPNAIILNEASVSFLPTRYFHIDAGVLPTEFSSLPSLWDANGFPSLREAFEVKGSLLKGSLFAMQSIPTSDSRTVQSTDNGVNTTLATYGLSLATNPDDAGALTLEGSVLRYQFAGLNSSAAADSQYAGNTVVSSGPQARFKYGFAGYEYAASGSVKLTNRVSVSMGGATIRNEEAPDESNRGYSYNAGIKFPVSTIDVGVSGGYYYNESDTLPASYTPSSRGSTNRFGNRFKLSFEDKPDSVAGFVQYTRANEIEDKPYTADREIIVFALEVAYEIL